MDLDCSLLRLPSAKRQWTMDNGQWTMDNGQWTGRLEYIGILHMSTSGIPRQHDGRRWSHATI